MTRRLFFHIGAQSPIRFLFAAAIVLSFVAGSIAPTLAAGGQTGGISGTVVEAGTRKPVVGVTVNLAAPSGTYRATTNGSGFFSLLGVPVDTYTLSIEAKGYEPLSESGITIAGDNTLSLGNVTVARELRTIGKVTSRSASGAFQPNQTTDSYTISGARIEQSAGRVAQTDENNVLLAAPGVTKSYTGNPTIRGSRLTEVGYQFDGVSFDEPFLSGNGSAGLVNGLGSVQVVEGAGDASQGLVGSGVINVIPKRGTYPSFGYINGAIGGPNFYHQASGEFGFATKNGSFSDYLAVNGERFQPYRATPAADYGNFFGDSSRANDQFLNNLILKFGHNNNQSLQFLYTNVYTENQGNLGGINLGTYDPTNNPAGLAYYPYNPATNFVGIPNYSSLIGLNPGTPATNVRPDVNQQNSSQQTEFLKFEYDNNLDANTYVALRYYNWSNYTYSDTNYSLGPINGNTGTVSVVGGPTTGGSLDLTRQFGSKLTVTVNGLYETLHPIWNDYQANITPLGAAFNASDADGANSPSYLDFEPGGYLSKFASLLPNGPGRLPVFGINFNGTYFQQYGGGVRFQYNPVAPLKFDFGVRYEGQNEHFINPNNPLNEGGNPFDVPAGQFSKNVTNPTEVEPRFAVSYELGRNDSVRASYGRSAVFSNAQDAGTPLGVYGIPTAFYKIPPKPGFACGTSFGTFFPCTSYGQQFYWSIDRHLDAPDAGGIYPANYSNYDLSFAHQFRNGWAARTTGFYRLGTNLPSASLLETLPNGGQIFAGSSKGFNRTTGAELDVTTPERPVGISGFLAATYQNVLQSAPPLSNFEANGTPTLSTATLALGNTYRAGYVSPFSLRTGATLKTKNGFTVTPVLQFDLGFPYSEGNLIAAQIGTDAKGNPIYGNVPQVNFGGGAPIIVGFYQQAGAALSTNYYDPAYSGTTTNPNSAFNRGTPSTSNSGGKLWTPNLNASLNFQYKIGRNALGVQFDNLFGNSYNGAIPLINPFYQPVASGLSGPLTGYNTTCGGSTAHGCANIPKNTYAYKNGAYLLSNGNVEGYQLAPLAPLNFQVYYNLAL